MDEQLRHAAAGKITAIPGKPMIANGTAVPAMAYPFPQRKNPTPARLTSR